VQDVVFGFGAHSGIAEGPELLRMAQEADRDGLDLFSLSDHPYIGQRLEAYAAVGFVLGRTQRLTGYANVSNLPLRPAPMLARTVTSLAALSGGRIVLGMGAGGLPERIGDLGGRKLSPADAVKAFEEGIVLIRKLCGGGRPVTHHGEFYRVDEIEPAPVPAPRVWTGSVGPRSLAATGRVADGWLPGHAADWISQRYRTSRPVIDEAAASVGRDPSEIRTIYNFPGQITDRPLPGTRDRTGRWIGGSIGQWVEELTGAIVDHGAGGFQLFSPQGGTPDARSVSIWGKEIVPAIREAIAKEKR
jgi:alkanesulfonate monooxygenase SsuD/methylene tetrahydromethanopterin reductase-like flavin-dependent oxidoreductase (luciferase family)